MPGPEVVIGTPAGATLPAAPQQIAAPVMVPAAKIRPENIVTQKPDGFKVRTSNGATGDLVLLSGPDNTCTLAAVCKSGYEMIPRAVASDLYLNGYPVGLGRTADNLVTATCGGVEFPLPVVLGTVDQPLPQPMMTSAQARSLAGNPAYSGYSVCAPTGFGSGLPAVIEGAIEDVAGMGIRVIGAAAAGRVAGEILGGGHSGGSHHNGHNNTRVSTSSSQNIRIDEHGVHTNGSNRVTVSNHGNHGSQTTSVTTRNNNGHPSISINNHSTSRR